jgi:hypothetical protein
LDAKNPSEVGILASFSRLTRNFGGQGKRLFGLRRFENSENALAISIDSSASPPHWQFVAGVNTRRVEAKVCLLITIASLLPITISRVWLRCHLMSTEAWAVRGKSPAQLPTSPSVATGKTTSFEVSFLIDNTKFVRNEIVSAVLHVLDTEGRTQKLAIKLYPERELGDTAFNRIK